MAAVAVEFHPAAREEFLAEIRWYAARSPAAAERFDAEFHGAMAALAEAPERWQPFHRNARRCVLMHFPFSVIYAVQATRVYVLAVAHDRRKPRYWVSRLDTL